MTEPFKINAPAVVHEMIDRKVVIVNLDSGRYYSLNKSGADIWDMLRDSHYFDTIYTRVQLFHSDDDSMMKADIAAFLDQLKKEELLVAAGHVPIPDGFEVYPSAGMLTPFVKPQLNVYSDLDKLLRNDSAESSTGE